MSDIPPETPPSGGGNFLTQKYGPLPGWSWLLITVISVFIFLKMRSSKQSSTTGTTTGGTNTTGTNTALSSNLVAFQEPVPTLNGTYQVQVTPENAPNSIYATTPNTSTQGVTPSSPPTGALPWGGRIEVPAPSPAVNVKPQTQSSSPQTQSNVG
jgi:hypothetical protein